MEMGKISRTLIEKNDGTPSTQPVASTTTVYGRAFKLGDGGNFCVSIRASGTGTPDIDVYLEQTPLNPDDASEGNSNGTGQAVVGDQYNGWAQAVGAAKIADITTNTWQHFVISPVALGWGRLKFIGQGTNPADCVVQQYISQKEDAA